MKLPLTLLMALLPVSSFAQTPSAMAGAPHIPAPKITAVIVIESPRQGVTLQQIMAIMPSEARATLQLYLDGKISQWYSRGDGKGVVFVVDAKTEGEARAVMETLPLARQQLINHEYIPVGPLMPLRAILGATR